MKEPLNETKPAGEEGIERGGESTGKENHVINSISLTYPRNGRKNFKKKGSSFLRFGAIMYRLYKKLGR